MIENKAKMIKNAKINYFKIPKYRIFGIFYLFNFLIYKYFLFF